MKINEIKIFGLSYFQLLFIFHILFVSILFIYIGFVRNETPNWLYQLLGIIAIIIILYHSYRLYTRGLRDNIWNYFHIFVIAPILLWVAYQKTKTTRIIYDFFIILGFGALGINLFKLKSSL